MSIQIMDLPYYPDCTFDKKLNMQNEPRELRGERPYGYFDSENSKKRIEVAACRSFFKRPGIEDILGAFMPHVVEGKGESICVLTPNGPITQYSNGDIKGIVEVKDSCGVPCYRYISVHKEMADDGAEYGGIVADLNYDNLIDIWDQPKEYQETLYNMANNYFNEKRALYGSAEEESQQLFGGSVAHTLVSGEDVKINFYASLPKGSNSGFVIAQRYGKLVSGKEREGYFIEEIPANADDNRMVYGILEPGEQFDSEETDSCCAIKELFQSIEERFLRQDVAPEVESFDVVFYEGEVISVASVVGSTAMGAENSTGAPADDLAEM